MSDQTSKAPLILGVSGLRGIVGQSLTPEIAARYAAAFGAWLKDFTGSPEPRVLIGRDGRAGGEALQSPVARGLNAAGCRVETAGVCTTPTVGHAVDAGGFHAGIVLTASHNPQQWNGIKFLVSGGGGGAAAPDASSANELVERFYAQPEVRADAADAAGEAGQVTQAHVDAVVERVVGLFKNSLSGIGSRTAVVDSVNSSGGAGSRALSSRLGFGLHQLHDDGSGIFPHTPEPTRENLSGEGGLCDAVPGLKADVGFAQDPDADRLAIIDEQGEYIGEEYTLVLCAMALLEARGDGATGSVLVTNLSTSRMIEDVAAEHGATVERTPVGEANVVQRMKGLAEEGRDVILGGEGNGGVIWPEVVYVRDSLSSMALTLALMARTNKTVSELVGQIDALSPGKQGYTIVKRKVDIPSKAAADPAVHAVSAWAATVPGARIDLQDGVRVDFEEGDWRGSWVHVRASNTEAIMRLIAEGPVSQDRGEGIAGQVLCAVESAIAG